MLTLNTAYAGTKIRCTLRILSIPYINFKDRACVSGQCSKVRLKFEWSLVRCQDLEPTKHKSQIREITNTELPMWSPGLSDGKGINAIYVRNLSRYCRLHL